MSEQSYDDLRPRYSMKRMRDELALAKRQARNGALYEAERVAKIEMAKNNTGSGFDSSSAYSTAWRIAAAIRKLAEEDEG